MSTEPDADQAVPRDTPQVSTSPWVLPGGYTVRLTAAGKTLSQPIDVVMDPRVKTTTAELEQQFQVSYSAYNDLLKASDALHQIAVLREQMKSNAATATAGKTPRPSATLGESFETNLEKLAGKLEPARTRGAPGPPTLASVRLQIARVEHSIQSADVQPTAAQVEAYHTASQPLAALLAQWETLKKTDLKALNLARSREHLALLQPDAKDFDNDLEDEIEMGDEE